MFYSSVVARYISHLANEEVEPEGGSSSSGVSSKWIQWLSEKHDKGNEKVPNPNGKTRDRFPQVSYSTALKDKSFRSQAVQEYRKWLEDSTEPSSEVSTKEEPDKDRKDKSPLKVDSSKIDAIIKEHGQKFDEIMGSMEKAAKNFQAKHSKPRFKSDQSHLKFKKAWKRLSPQEQAIMAAGDQVGQYFQEYITKKNNAARKVGKEIEGRWRLAPDMSKSEAAQNMMGLAEAWGIKGSKTPSEESKEADKYREEGKNNKELNEYAQEAYEFTQAFFKHLGIKEIKLFRGVQGQGIEKAKKGAEVDMETRPLSSYSLNAATAANFGKVVEFKIPVEEVFTSTLTSPEFKNEAEMVVMGGPKKGKVL